MKDARVPPIKSNWVGSKFRGSGPRCTNREKRCPNPRAMGRTLCAQCEAERIERDKAS